MVSGIPRMGSLPTMPTMCSVIARRHSCRRKNLLEGETWYCERCKAYVQAQKTLGLWRLPEVVVVLIKRFEKRGRKYIKLDALLSFPERGLDLTPHLAHAQACPALCAGDFASWWVFGFWVAHI